jgi:hypothetical protein
MLYPRRESPGGYASYLYSKGVRISAETTTNPRGVFHVSTHSLKASVEVVVWHVVLLLGNDVALRIKKGDEKGNQYVGV